MSYVRLLKIKQSGPCPPQPQRDRTGEHVSALPVISRGDSLEVHLGAIIKTTPSTPLKGFPELSGIARFQKVSLPSHHSLSKREMVIAYHLANTLWKAGVIICRLPRNQSLPKFWRSQWSTFWSHCAQTRSIADSCQRKGGPGVLKVRLSFYNRG